MVTSDEPELCACGCGEPPDPGKVWRMECYRLELAYRSILLDRMIAKTADPRKLIRISGL